MRLPTGILTKTSSPSAPNISSKCSFTANAEREIARNIYKKLRCPWDLAVCFHTVYLMRISSERGYSFTTTEEREIGRGVKEKLCSIAFDYDTELKSIAQSSNKKQTHVLSDRNNISVGAECFRCESVFPAKCHWQRCQRNPRHFLPKETDGIGSVFNFFQRMLSGCGSIRGGFHCGFGTSSEPLFFFSLSLSDCDTLTR